MNRNSSEKDYENKTSNSNAQRFEILLKPFEKNKKNEKKIDGNDDEIHRMPVSQPNGKINDQNKNINSFYVNKEPKLMNKSKVMSGVAFNGHARSNRKFGGML